IVVPAVGTVLSSQTVPAHRAFDLSRYDVGLEKTLFDGRVSVYLRVPYLDATHNTSNQPIDGFGDISAGFKVALLADKDTGSALTVGLTVSAPTARDAVVTTTTQNVIVTYPAFVR